MRVFSPLFVLWAAVLVAESKTIADFRMWAQRHGKLYTAAEEARRFQTWSGASSVIADLNRGANNGAVFSLDGPFADLSPEEFRNTMIPPIRRTHPAPRPTPAPAAPAEPTTSRRAIVPTTMDLRSYFPPIKNQGRHRTVVSLSEQQLVSCDDLHSGGCSGGSAAWAMMWVLYRNGGGLASTSDFLPYTSGVNGSYTTPECPAAPVPSAVHYSTMRYYEYVTWDYTIMSYMVQYGPLKVAVSAEMFQYYDSGVLDTPLCLNQWENLDHEVVLAGYGTDPATGKPYWLLRNSWGPLWGESGYIRIVRGKNMCGINIELATLIV
eukprot:m51a1_g2594 hypothetical protein (322) ;mRNA; r:438853-440007